MSLLRALWPLVLSAANSGLLWTKLSGSWTKPVSRSPTYKPKSTNCAPNCTAHHRNPPPQPNPNSPNPSPPPSVDPPGAPKPVIKTPTGRKPGGQPGHPGHHRHRFPPERVNKIVPYVPATCTDCQAPLPSEAAPGDPEPTWHQVAELPELAANITEHQAHARTCPCCGPPK